MRKILFVLLFHNYIYASTPVKVGLKHMMIISADAENIWGSYYFGVFNDSKDSQVFSTKIMLAKQASDFQVRQGSSTDSVQLGKDGSLTLTDKFVSGMTLVNIDFKIPLQKFGTNTMNFVAPMDFSEVNIVVPNSLGLKLDASGFVSGVNDMMSAQKYEGIIRTDIKKGEIFEVEVAGLPLSPYYSWIVALVFACALFLGSFLLITRSIMLKPCRS
jgi:hypothetical protein